MVFARPYTYKLTDGSLAMDSNRSGGSRGGSWGSMEPPFRLSLERVMVVP